MVCRQRVSGVKKPMSFALVCLLARLGIMSMREPSASLQSSRTAPAMPSMDWYFPVLGGLSSGLPPPALRISTGLYPAAAASSV